MLLFSFRIYQSPGLVLAKGCLFFKTKAKVKFCQLSVPERSRKVYSWYNLQWVNYISNTGTVSSKLLLKSGVQRKNRSHTFEDAILTLSLQTLCFFNVAIRISFTNRLLINIQNSHLLSLLNPTSKCSFFKQTGQRW